jgi:hypothetical protein
MPKWWCNIVSTNVTQTASPVQYIAITPISSLNGGGFIANANISFTSAAPGNDKIFAQYYINGNPMGISTVFTNTGNGHSQTLSLTLASTFNVVGGGAATSTNTVAVYVRNNAATPANYTTNSATMTVGTNLI